MTTTRNPRPGWGNRRTTMIYCCQHYTHDDYHTRCMTDAAYYLRDNEGKRVPGVWCEKLRRVTNLSYGSI